MSRTSRQLGLLTLLCAVLTPAATAAERFHFVALGDTAYNPTRDYPVYERLISAINATRPAFSIHVGDTWGATECSTANHEDILDWFGKYDHPLVYTPGDNEWTDCREPQVLAAYTRYVTGNAGPTDLALLGSVQGLDNAFAGKGYADTLASLATIRRVFFSAPRSLGGTTMPLMRQADGERFKDMVENVRWNRDGVVFATVNVTGSQNGFTINDQRRATEAVQRNAANVAWLRSTFTEAQNAEAKAVVISMHASIFLERKGDEFSARELRGWQDGPYYWIALAVRELGEKFGRPVLLIHGDFHEFIVDRPFLVSRGEVESPRFANITRLQVFGAPELRAVRVDVDTDTPWVFGFTPLYVE